MVRNLKQESLKLVAKFVEILNLKLSRVSVYKYFTGGFSMHLISLPSRRLITRMIRMAVHSQYVSKLQMRLYGISPTVRDDLYQIVKEILASY